MIEVIDKVQKEIGDDFLDRYFLWLESLNNEDGNIITSNQINNLIKKIDILKKQNYKADINYEKYKQCSEEIFMQILECQDFESFSKNTMIDKIITTNMNYKLYEYENTLQKLEDMYFEFFDKIRNIFNVIGIVLFSTLKYYNLQNLYKMHDLCADCILVLKIFAIQYSKIDFSVLSKTDRKKYVKYKSFYNQFVRTILNLITNKLYIIESIAEYQKSIVLGRIKLILSMDYNNTMQDVILIVKKIFKFNNYLDKSYDETLNSRMIQVFLSQNVKKNKKVKMLDHENYTKIRDELVAIFNKTEETEIQIQNFIIMSIVYLKIKEYVFQLNKYYFEISQFIIE